MIGPKQQRLGVVGHAAVDARFPHLRFELADGTLVRVADERTVVRRADSRTRPIFQGYGGGSRRPVALCGRSGLRRRPEFGQGRDARRDGSARSLPGIDQAR
jgi:hypothetical protein